MQKITYLLWALIFLAAATVFLWEDDNRAVMFAPEGVRVQGSFIGNSIGDRQEDVNNKMIKKSIKRIEVRVNKPCVGVDFNSDFVEVYYDDSWRRGVICVGYISNAVNKIAWHYNPLEP